MLLSLLLLLFPTINELPSICRELQVINTSLRAENAELTSRVRQLESRTAAGGGGGGLNSTQDISTLQKYKTIIERLKKELVDLSAEYQRLKHRSAEEISKWRATVSKSFSAEAPPIAP